MPTSTYYKQQLDKLTSHYRAVCTSRDEWKQVAENRGRMIKKIETDTHSLLIVLLGYDNICGESITIPPQLRISPGSEDGSILTTLSSARLKLAHAAFVRLIGDAAALEELALAVDSLETDATKEERPLYDTGCPDLSRDEEGGTDADAEHSVEKLIQEGMELVSAMRNYQHDPTSAVATRDLPPPRQHPSRPSTPSNASEEPMTTATDPETTQKGKAPSDSSLQLVRARHVPSAYLSHVEDLFNTSP